MDKSRSKREQTDKTRERVLPVPSSGEPIRFSEWDGEERNEPKPPKRDTPRSRRIAGRSAACLVGVLLFCAGATAASLAVLYGRGVSDIPTEVPSIEEPKADEPAQEQPKEEPIALSPAEIYEERHASVVSVRTSSATASGIGSGFVFSADGYIATANHVIAGMDRVSVILDSGEEYEARVVGSDEMTDLALLHIEAEGLPVMPVGDSAALSVGDRVIAIGTPASLDYSGSFCSGDVSYQNRTVRIYDSTTGYLKKKMTLLQINNPVNPGNSGCPLLDEYGRVVGVVTMKLGDRYEGVGFAVPINGAYPLLETMREGREPTDDLRASVSVRAGHLPLVAESAQADGRQGVRITGFEDSTSDAAHKLRKGDLITHLSETAILSPEALRAAVENVTPNTEIHVTVWREGQSLVFPVRVE